MKHYLESAEAVFQEVNSNENGLSSAEAAARLEANGKNKLAEAKKDSMAKKFFDQMKYMALPLIVMTLSSLGGMTRYVRASMTEALSMDCIRTARAKGLREKVVIYSHAWRNALIPIVTLVIGWFLSIFSGSIMIENIFGLNGMGLIYINSLTGKDFEVVLLLQMFYVIVGLLGNLLIDIAYGFVDPRIRVNK